jgi:hypothetical protein
MAKDSTMPTNRASLCALGEYLKRHCFFAPLRDQMQISQKTVRYRPVEKVLDALLGALHQKSGQYADPSVNQTFLVSF